MAANALVAIYIFLTRLTKSFHELLEIKEIQVFQHVEIEPIVLVWLLNTVIGFWIPLLLVVVIAATLDE